MRVFYWDDVLSRENSICEKSAITIGGFDGMHLGHEALFAKLFDYKKKHPEAAAGIVTFTRSPAFAKKNDFAGDVLTLRLKLEILKRRGFDFCIMIDFSEKFSKIVGRDFLDILRKFCSMQFLAEGFDFRCGYKSDTGVAELSDYARGNGLELEVLSNVLTGEKRVSSSLVRDAVRKGELAFARELLGRPYCIDGMPLSFKVNGSSASLLSMIADRKTKQVLPPDGDYPADIVFAGGASEEHRVRGSFHVESSFLRLELPLGQNALDVPSHGGIDKIEFA